MYIAADSELPTIEWRAELPGFHLKEIATHGRELRAKLSKRHIYYVGSHAGCGCGFRMADTPPDESEPEARLTKASHQDFALYLRRHLQLAGSIEMFACWEGDQGAPANDRGVIDPMTVASESFYFEELALWTVATRR